MSARRFLAFLLGVWLGGSLLVSVAAIHNLGSVESRLDSLSPAAAKLIEPLGHDLAGRLLRHHSSELNRAYFEQWGMAQLAIGVAVFGTLLFGTREGKWLVVIAFLMLVIVVVLRFILTPDLVNFGRQLDFATKQTGTSEYSRFYAIHRAYVTADAFKFGLGLVLLGLLLRRSQRRRRPVRQLDLVDNADDRHIDR